MSSYAEVMAVVEGTTEKMFIEKVVAPYLASRNVVILPMLISKPGQNGGDVKFARAKNDIGRCLKQRADTYVTLFIDYYGIRSDWPGLDLSEREQEIMTAEEKARRVNEATHAKVRELHPDSRADQRFIPFIAMHEFEALLFSAPEILASKLNIDRSQVDSILQECGSPENINNSPRTAPSKRLFGLAKNFKKVSTGVAIAQAIGLPAIRSQCPLFNAWVGSLENLSQL